MIIISAGLGAFFSLFGIYLSYYFDIASGASVVLLSTLGFAVAIAWSSLVQRLQIARRLKANSYTVIWLSENIVAERIF